MEQIREHWTGRIGFLMAAIGSAIGLGILWKFPYIVGENGGSLFLLSYFLCIIIVGIPIFVAELILGRKTQRAAVGAYDLLDHKRKGWKTVGYFGVLASFLIMSFYSVIAGWGLSYLLFSLGGGYQLVSEGELAHSFQTLSQSGGITLFWHFIFTFITGAIVISGVRKGIELWAKLMTKSLFLLLLLLFFYVMSLEGFGRGFHFIFSPNLSEFRFSSVIEALGLAFWTLSIGQGIMISYGSYMKRKESIFQMAFVVAASVILAAVLASLVIFPVVFTFHLPPEGGMGLIFQTLPVLFSKLPAPLFLSTVFFTLFVFTALTSAIPLVEVVATNIMELFQVSRKKATLIVASATFLFGIPSAFSAKQTIFPGWDEIYGGDFLRTVDQFVSIWVIPIGGLLSAIFVGWVVKKEELYEELLVSSKARFLLRPWHFFVRWIVPLTILLIIIQKSGLVNFDRFFSFSPSHNLGGG